MIRCRNCAEYPATEEQVCMVCKRRSDIDPYKALIAMALLVYCGVSLAAYLKPRLPPAPAAQIERYQESSAGRTTIGQGGG